jgi:hypothetical protein
LKYLKIMDSGHMVPMDVPEVALDMMRLFLYGGNSAFQYSPQQLARAETNAECPSCPICPTNASNYDADTRASIATDDEYSKGSSMNNTTIFIGVGLGVLFLGVAYALYRRSKYSSLSTGATYDLEMRGGTYFDDPDGSGGAVKAADGFRER